ncbi:MAG: hypothetical protein HOV81_08935 [Kofleriaceae bacterium]|nr:hypothetical protein [Kofleriaceae bacterium]
MTARDYSTISPSAQSLLAMRAQTSLPYARRAAEIVFGVDTLEAELARLRAKEDSQARLFHFTERYRSLDTLLDESGATRIVELGSGLSCRGLALAERKPVTYVDTDLPAMAATKRQLVDALAVAPLAGELRIRDLDALNVEAFRAIVDDLPPGPFAIVNEGLLMYLDGDEKQRLAATIREILIRRGGVWITADIYLRTPRDPRTQDERLRRFLEAHRVDENKFESLAAAETYFDTCGFAITRRLARSDDAIRESWVVSPR